MSAPNSLPPLPPDIGKLTEPLVVGLILQWALFGALSVQVYIYYLAFPKDPLQRKLLVYGVFAAEMVQAILFARVGYIQFGIGFGSLEAIDFIPPILWFGVPILSSCVETVVQIFYAYRIKLLSETYIVPCVVVFLAFVQLGGGIGLGVLSEETPFFSKLLNNRTDIAAGIWYGTSVLCDVLIAVHMTYLLYQRNCGLKKTQRLVHKLIRLIIETGMMTATFAIINLILFLIPSKTMYFATTISILGKMYSNSMMVLLNSRMVYGIVNDTASMSDGCRRSLFFPSQPSGAHPSTHESDTLEYRLEDSIKNENDLENGKPCGKTCQWESDCVRVTVEAEHK